MKKQLFLMSALALTALTSCGGSKGNQPYTPGNPIKVGLICLHSDSTYDKNFQSAFKEAMDEAKEKGYVSGYEIKTDVPEEGRDCYDAAEQFVNSGCNVIFSDSFGHDVSMHEAAGDFKNVQFSSATGIEARKSGLSNFHNAFASIYEGRYLEGVAAGLYMQEKNLDHTIGYVGAFPYAEVISGYTSWFLGVKSIISDVQMKVTYTSTWYGYAEEKTAAEKLISAGCKLISQHADSMGAPDACQTANIPNVSYNISTYEGHAETYLGHSRINWKPYYSKFIEAMYKGEKLDGEKEQNWTGTLETGSVEYSVSDLLNEESKAKIKETENKLRNGEIHVFDTSNFTVNDLASKYTDPDNPAPVKGTDYEIDTDGHLTKMMGATDMYVPDTDLVAEDKVNNTHYINESYFRSAPSFNYIIDNVVTI